MLKTFSNHRGIGCIRKFQSLIGMLKTTTEPNSRAETNWGVSIPHRYAENDAIHPWGLQCAVVSIPHRYAENRSKGPHPTCRSVFQSLIGMLKTGQNYLDIINKHIVSIPHRYAENFELLEDLSRYNASFNPS